MKTIEIAPRPNPETRPPTSNASPSFAREVGRERLGALLQLLADVGPLVEPLE